MDNYRRGAPYRATRMWNEVVVAFRSGMPLKKHRRHMRSFENCFSASEAVDWLHNFLRSNHSFGPDVTRQQTVQLLQKFMKAGVFVSVKSNSKNNQEEFKDNSQLYKFSYHTHSMRQSPVIALIRAPLSVLNVNNYNKMEKPKKSNSVPFFSNKFGIENNRFALRDIKSIPECFVVSRSLSIREIENTWKSVIISRLQDIVNGKDIDELIDRKLIDGHIIMHNATRFSKTGVVTLTDRTDDLPHWVMSAMKCLTNWPNANGSSSCLPNYPGFEMDVFKVVKDYFTNMGIPLIPFNLYPLFMYIFETLYYQTERNMKSTVNNKETLENNSAATFSSFEKLLIQKPIQSKEIADSEQKTSTPVYQAVGLSSVQLPSEISTSTKQLHNDKFILKENHTFDNYPEDFCFETAFITVSPVTRLVVNYPKEHGSQSSLHTLTSQATSGIETASTISACSHSFSQHRDFNLRPPLNPSFVTVKSTNDLHELSLTNKVSYFSKEIQETPRCSSVDNLNHSIRISKRNQNTNFHVLNTLPRKLTSHSDGFSKNTESCGIKGYGSLRQLKYDHKFKKEELAKNSQSLSYSKKLVDNQSDSTMNSYYTAHSSDDNSWNTCNNNTVIDYSSSNQNSSHFQNNSLKQPIEINESKETDKIKKEISIQSPNLADNDQKRDQFWRKPSLQVARKTILSSLKIPVYRPPTPVSCSKRVNLKIMSENQNLKFACDEILPPRPEPDGESSCNYKIDEDHKNRLIAALQLCLLLLPSPNRRHLHLLLRMIYKILENNELNLYNHIMTREFLLNTFTRCILCAENEIDYNEIQALALISFLLDECESVFQISSSLKTDIENKLTEMQRGRIKYTVDDSCSLAYCEQVSLPQYEEQKNMLSQQALTDLLENLISNPNMSDKEKRRKIKQFKENHLDVYLSRFPTEATEAALFSRKPKQNILSRILSVRL